jgi:hypothetical protein
METLNEDDAEGPPGGSEGELAATGRAAPERTDHEDASAEAASEDDEDVSLEELMMGDSEAEEEEEEEATDIHPGLSEALLAESLRAAPTPAALTSAALTPAALTPAALTPAALAPAGRAEPGADEDSARELAPLAVDAFEESESVGAGEEVDALLAELAAADAGVAQQDELELGREAPELEGADAEALEMAALAERAPVQEEPTRPDASPSDVLEAAPESEVEVLSSATIEAMTLEAEAALEAEEPIVPSQIELEDSGLSSDPPSSPSPTTERETMPEPLAAKRRDAPLPSFDIPDLEALSASTAGAALAGEARARTAAHPVTLPPLSEIAEDDDDDAVTHMGLPSVSDAANDYPAVSTGAASGFQVADPAVAALQSLDADISRGDPRRATTRVIPRIDPKTLPPAPRRHVRAGPPLTERLGVMVRSARERMLQLLKPEAAEPLLDSELSPGRRRLNWMVENVLPPLSLVLFGSGIGAAVILLVEPDRPAEASSQTQTIQALQEAGSAARAPLTLADRARAGDGEALYKITNMQQSERTSTLTLALEAGYQAQKLREFKEFVRSTAAASKALPATSVSRMVDYATSPETMLPAFQELTQWTGPVGPDVLYAVWEKAAGGSRAASLAQQLLYSADQRAKATPALLAALDLRSAANCDDYLRVLPAVARNGDQRSSATLRALRHNDGCGADGQQDCYACLRDNSLLEDALKAVEAR